MTVSILILTHNEASNLEACLSAVSWCDDVVVVDSGSTDGTVDIAIRNGARVLTRAFDNFAAQRNFGLDAAAFKNEWVLHLDADEIVTDAFARALASWEPEPAKDAWRVPFKMMLMGRWLRHAGMWPGYQVRLGHVQRLRFIQVGHGQREDLPPGRVGIFPEALLHFSFSHGMRSWLHKHLRYAQDEAQEIARQRADGSALTRLLVRDSTERRRAAKALSARLPLFLRPPARFLYLYFYRLGFLDGKPGFVYAFLLAVYEGMIAILGWGIAQDNRQNPTANSISAGFQNERITPSELKVP